MADHAYRLEARTSEFVASVQLPGWEPHEIMRGGPVTVRPAEGEVKPIVLRSRWSDDNGITDCDRAVRVTAELSYEKIASLEVALHDAATEQIAATCVAREHRVDRYQALCILFELVGQEGPDGFEAIATRPHCLRSWIDPEHPYQLAGASGWVFWWEESEAAVSVLAGPRSEHGVSTGNTVSYYEGVAGLGEALALAAGRLRCQCGEVTGTHCPQFRLRSEMMIVEWTPYQLRAEHEAAGCQDTYPANGALRLLCCVECGAMLVESEPDWAHMFLGE